jgi:hypothetical protein
MSESAGSRREVERPLGSQRFDEQPLGLLHGAKGLNGLNPGDDELQTPPFRPNVNAADDDDFAADLNAGVHGQAGVAPDDAIHLTVIVSQGEVDVAVVDAPGGDLALQGLVLKERVVLDRVLDQASELTDGQRARRRFMTR